MELGKETVLTLLLIECVRRLTKNGKAPIHITEGQLSRVLEENLEVDYSDSTSDKFVLKLIEGEEIVVGEIESKEVVVEDAKDESVSS